MAVHVLHAWNEWGIQALVLFSLALQVALLVLAEFRRGINSGVLKFFIWLAYILADSTATFVLGHLSVTNRSPRQQLMAFWAPFLLLHLGGQDNITAYSIEDNNLWLRHLQTFVVQVAAAAYVLYESSILNGGSGSMLWSAAVLMFAVGVVKYAERVWALRCATTSLANKNYENYGWGLVTHKWYYYAKGPVWKLRDTEALLLMAHRLLHVAQNFLKGPSVTYPHKVMPYLSGENFYRIVEMELSLMHDVLYTKAEVMHTWYGLCIRVFVTLATSVAFLFFYHHHHLEGYSRVDVTVTYVLLAGALVLEMMSVLRAMLSSWTLASLLIREDTMYYDSKNPCQNELLAGIVWHLRRHLHVANWRRRFYWSGSMGQHNLAQLCAQSKGSRRSKIAKWMGVEDLWNTHAYSSPIAVPPSVKRLLYEGSWRFLVQKREHDPALKLARELWSKSHGLKTKDDHDALSSLDEYILTWHIATDMFLDWWKNQDQEKLPNADDEELGHKELAEAVEALSNYMLFLLASRPYMLPPGVSRNPYVVLCYNLRKKGSRYNEALWRGRSLGRILIPEKGEWTYAPTESESESEPESEGGGGGEAVLEVEEEEEAVLEVEEGQEVREEGDDIVDIHEEEEKEPLHQEGLLKLKQIALVWAEMLCYAGHRCSASSHAKQLNNGVELITIAALLVEHSFNEKTDARELWAKWNDCKPSGYTF